jgi:hypothetical protein
VQRRLLLDIVVVEGASILELLAGEDQALLVRGNAVHKSSGNAVRLAYLNSPFLVLDLGFNIVDGVGRLHLKGDRLPREGLDENLHLEGVSLENGGDGNELTLKVVDERRGNKSMVLYS